MNLAHRLPIKGRLTLWYLLLMGGLFTLFSIYLILRYETTLILSVDQSLKAIFSQAIAGTENENGLPTFQINDDSELGMARPQLTNFALRLVLPGGQVIDEFDPTISAPSWGELQVGFQTTHLETDEETWRVYTQAFRNSNGELIAWLQVAESLESVQASVQNLKEQLIIGIPLLLTLAGFGGYFIANRALQPITHITNTARHIEASELSQRISYSGPEDEVGQLANTFNEMLERLQAAFDREKRFTSDAAHELRTPLGILKGQIEVTLSKLRKPKDYVEQLESLGVHVERLIRMSSALLVLSSFDKKPAGGFPQVVDLAEMLNNLLMEFAPLLKEKGLAFSSHVENSLYTNGDPDQLIQLFINLMENALKFTPPDGAIEMSGALREREIVIRIRNSAAPVPADKIPLLFDPFYRADPSRSSQIKGNGLGLSIAKEIVKSHKGRIELSSSPHNGFQVIVRLPAAQEGNYIRPAV